MFQDSQERRKYPTLAPNPAACTWRAPTSDGGAPITGYVIERQTEIGGRWIPLKSKAVTTEFEVRDLYEGQKYEFRVIAENKAGLGKPSESAGPIVAKSQYSKYRFCFTRSEMKFFTNVNYS
jgi:hypothetical protein